MSARREPVRRISRPDWPEGTDPQLIADFDEAIERLQVHFDEIHADLDREERVRRRRRRMFVAVVVWQAIGLAVCVAAFAADTAWAYWSGYAMVITGMVYLWWDAGYFHRLWAWTKRKVTR